MNRGEARRTMICLSATAAVLASISSASCSGSIDLGAGEMVEDAGLPSWKIPPSGDKWEAGAPEELVTAQRAPYDLAVHNGRLYWTSEVWPFEDPAARIQSCDPNDCANTLLALAAADDPHSRARSVAVDAESVFWVDEAGLRRCPIGGCTGQTASLDLQGSAPMYAALDEDSVFWTSAADSAVFK